MSTLTARFRRLGSEAEADDRAARRVDPISDADLASALAATSAGPFRLHGGRA